jgi:uncharacterized membrane protein
MRNIVVVTFTEPSKAYQALSVVKELDDSERISLHAAAVVERWPGGEPAVRDYTDRIGPVRRPHGLVGRLIDGLMGRDEALELATSIPPGTTGVIAEVGEYASDVIDSAMGQLGGTVFRWSTEQVKDAFAAAEEVRREADIKAARARMATAEQQAQAVWDTYQQDRERERIERHNERLARAEERLDRLEHWLEEQKKTVPA